MVRSQIFFSSTQLADVSNTFNLRYLRPDHYSPVMYMRIGNLHKCIGLRIMPFTISCTVLTKLLYVLLNAQAL